MRILVTNDDGIESPGLRALARAVAHRGHEVFVVAPSREFSGAGAAIGPIHKQDPAPVWIHDWPELPGGEVVALDGPPALCTYGACLGAFGAKPDLVVSGVNPGLNTGHLVIHSGTVGAAMTAATYGISAVAVSIEWAEDPYWDTAAALAADAVPVIAARPGGPIVCNLNVPNRRADDVRGVRDARLGTEGAGWVVEAAHIDERLVLDFMLNEDAPRDPSSDVVLVGEGFATVTILDGVAQITEPLADLVAAAGERP